MKKKLWLICLLVLCLFTACASASEESGELDRAAEQIQQALPGGFEKIAQTDVYDYVFSSEDGSEMILHLCITTYDDESAVNITGLDIAAISAVFDAANTALVKEFTASGHSAAIYQGETCNYLCWTTSAQASAVMEYDPDSISEEEAMRIVQSVYEVPEE